MTNEELKKWFINKFNSCYPAEHDYYSNCIFLFYDETLVRKIKMYKLNNIECNIDKITGKCLFEFDYKNSYLWCDKCEIWSIFEKNYSSNYNDIKSFIWNILKEQEKLKVLTHEDFSFMQYDFFKRKINELEPACSNISSDRDLSIKQLLKVL